MRYKSIEQLHLQFLVVLGCGHDNKSSHGIGSRLHATHEPAVIMSSPVRPQGQGDVS